MFVLETLKNPFEVMGQFSLSFAPYEQVTKRWIDLAINSSEVAWIY